MSNKSNFRVLKKKQKLIYIYLCLLTVLSKGSCCPKDFKISFEVQKQPPQRVAQATGLYVIYFLAAFSFKILTATAAGMMNVFVQLVYIFSESSET